MAHPPQHRPGDRPTRERGMPGWVVGTGLVLGLLAVLWVGGLVLGAIGAIVGLAVKLAAGVLLVGLVWFGGRRLLGGGSSRGELRR